MAPDKAHSASQRLAESLRFGSDQIDLWCEPKAGIILCRVDRETFGQQARTRESRDGRLRIIFWGNLYETTRIQTALGRSREKLHVPASDAGLALALYEDRGDEAFKLLDGSFALAIYDSESRELVLANDRFSSRPIYWANTSTGGVAFGTLVHAVLQVGGVSRELNEHAVQQVVHFQRVLGRESLNAAVSMLPPATLLRHRNGQTLFKTWFEMDYRPERRSSGEWAEELADAFHLATRRASGTAGRVGLLLSGGLDSRMVAAAADRDVVCFHFNDAPNEEYATAREVARTRNLSFVYIQRPEDHYVRLFEPSVELGDGEHPFVNSHSIGLLPEGELDVVLHGFAPELFFRGKNLPRRYYKLGGKKLGTTLDRSLSQDTVASAMVRKLNYNQNHQNPKRFFQGRFADSYDEQIFAAAQAMVDEGRQHSESVYDWYTWPDTRYHAKYPSFLFEAALRAYQPERSVVFHNHILDLHLRMPIDQRADSRIWALAIERLAPDIASIPDANTGLPPLLPAPMAFGIDAMKRIGRFTRIRRRPPLARGTTRHSWPNFRQLIIHHPGVRHLIQRILTDPECLDPAIFDMSAVETAFNDHLVGRANYDLVLFQLVTFGWWHRKYGPPGHGLP